MNSRYFISEHARGAGVLLLPSVICPIARMKTTGYITCARALYVSSCVRQRLLKFILSSGLRVHNTVVVVYLSTMPCLSLC